MGNKFHNFLLSNQDKGNRTQKRKGLQSKLGFLIRTEKNECHRKTLARCSLVNKNKLASSRNPFQSWQNGEIKHFFDFERDRHSLIAIVPLLSNRHFPSGHTRAARQHFTLGAGLWALHPRAAISALGGCVVFFFPLNLTKWLKCLAGQAFLLLVEAQSGKNTKQSTLGLHKTYFQTEALPTVEQLIFWEHLCIRIHANLSFNPYNKDDTITLILRQRRSPSVCVMPSSPRPVWGMFTCIHTT